MLTPKHLSPEQNQAYKDILRNKIMCLSSECGFGKSVVGLTSFSVLLKKRPESKMLVVCTKKGVEGVWCNEHKQWSHLKHLNVTSLIGTPEKRTKLLQNESDVYAITYNNLKWLAKTNKGRNKVAFNFVFADEGDCLKGPTSKWRSALIKCAPKARWRIISSATPKTREEDDYWGLCKYLDDGKCLGTRTVGEFRNRYCVTYMINKMTMWRVNPKMIQEIEDRIAPLFCKYELSEQAKIPIKTITCHASLSEASWEKYTTLRNEQCINSIVYDGHIKNQEKSLDALTLSNKLAQLSNGFVYVNEDLRITPDMLAKVTNNRDIKSLINKSKKRVAVDVFDDRIRAFDKLITRIHKEHGSDCRIAVPYLHNHELVQLKRVLPCGTPDTEPDFKERWDDGEIQYLFLQYSRSSKSLNLQKGGNIMVFYSPTWKWADDYQIVRRLARQGQTEPCVYAYRLYMKGTTDDHKTKKLSERFQGHSRFQKRIIRSIAHPQ